MKYIKIKRQLVIIFSLSLNLLFMVNYSTAEVVKYRINAVVDSSNWPADGSCASEVSQPGTTAQLYLDINEPIIPSADLICQPDGCEQTFTNVVLGWSIKFSAGDECTIHDTTEYGMDLYVVHVYDDDEDCKNVELCDRIIIGREDFQTQCLSGYDDNPAIPVIGGPLCLFTGMAGDPSDSSNLLVTIKLIDLIDPTATLFDPLAPPITLATIAADPTFAEAKCVIGAFDPISQTWFQITYTLLDVIILNQPSSLIFDLIDATSEINASNGVLNSLDAKLESAFEALDDVNENNDLSAVNKLQAFINAVEAQRGKHISEDEADSLVAAAQEIIDMLNMQ